MITRLILILIAVVYASIGISQTTILSENFDALVSGSTAVPSGWLQDPSDNDTSPCSTNHCDWYSRSGGTPSNGTGPPSDNTSGAGIYMFVEASNNNTNSPISLITPTFDLGGDNGELEFYLYRLSNGTAPTHQFHIDVLDGDDNSVIQNDVIASIGRSNTAAWERRIVNLSAFKNNGSIRIRFRETISSQNWRLDFAIDDVKVSTFDEVYLEAECGVIGSNWNIVSDGSASNSEYVVYPTGVSYNSAPGAIDDRLTYTFTTAIATTYYFFGRVSGPSSDDDSFWFRVDGGTWYKWNSWTNGGFDWVEFYDSDNSENQVSYSLSAGSHTLEMTYREDGSQLDKIYISNANTAPSGTGDVAINCSGALVGCWPFDTDADDSEDSNDGIESGSPTYSVAIFDEGIDLDGIDDMVSISHGGELAPTEFTMMIWVQAPAAFAAGQEVIFENNRSGSDWYALYKSSAVDKFRFKMGTQESDIDLLLTPGDYYHVAITYIGGTAEYFMNGTSIGTLTGITDLSGNSATLTIGSNSVGEAYEGSLDEFKIFDEVMTQSEIQDAITLSCSGIDINEICFNGIDDDGDGMIDDIDPDCCDPLGTGEAYFPAGDALSLGNNTFQVTADANSEAGALWYKARANLAFDFEFAFQINLGTRDADGADGLAFVIHNDSRGYSAFGGPGQGLGYGAQLPLPPGTVPIVPSIAIEFDTWYNTEGGTPYTDITDDHTTITYGGDIRNIINVEGIVCLSNSCANVEDGADHDVLINWEANTQTLSMSFDGVARVSYTGDIVNQYLNGTPTVFFGFTGSTGGSTNLQTFEIDSLDIVLVEICGNGVDDDCNGLIDENDSWCKNRCGNIVNANISVSGDAGINEAPLGWSTGNPSSLASTTSGSGTVNLGAVSLDDADNLTVFSGEASMYDTGPGIIFSVPNDDGEAQFMVGQETDGILQVIDGLTIGADYRFTFDAAYTWLSGATEPTTATLQLILDPPNTNLEDDTPVDSHTFSASNTVESLILEFTATSMEHEVIIYADNLPVDYIWFLELGSGGCGVSRDIVTNFFLPSKMKNN